MGLLDFIFGKKKTNGTSQNQVAKTAINNQGPVSQEPMNVNKKEEPIITSFVFESNQHQRYENGKPVQGLQICPRLIKLEENTHGCNGYQLRAGDGYIVRMINGDTGNEQMAPKPMRVIKSTESELLLRGYKVNAMTPFGFQEVDMADYGLSVVLNNSKVAKCTLHMYDRNVDIEYSQKNSIVESNQEQELTIKSEQKKEYIKPVSDAEEFINQALSHLKNGNDGDETYHPLYKAWKSICHNPKQLKDIQNYGDFGCGMMVFLSYGTVQDIDYRQQISSIAYLCLSLAIRTNPRDVNLLKNRLVLMLTNREAFEYTVSSVVNKDEGIMFMNLHAFAARDAMFKMEYADLSRDQRLQSIEMLASSKCDLRNKIQTGFFGNNKDESTIISEGDQLHKDILDYLINKVLKEENIDF